MALFRWRLLRWLLPLAILVLILGAAPLWLGALGSFLVRAEEPLQADMIVVLAGDYTGRRIVMASELVKRGYAPQALISGPCCFYGKHEDQGAIAFAVASGYPAEWFIPLPMVARSTREEAAVVLGELRRRGVRSFLVVTSNYHTRRAGSVYRGLARPEERIRVVAAPDQDFRPESWWRSRQGQKQVFLEWSKTLAGWIGL